jgi:hypothetical protein
MRSTIMTELKNALWEIIEQDRTVLDQLVDVRTLSPLEAIGNPGDWDFPLLRGREILLQATFRQSSGQAFTSNPNPYQGTLAEVMNLDLDCLENRAVFIAVLNAFLRNQGLIENTIHCRDQDPEECGKQIADYLKTKHNPSKIGVAGYQPALISALCGIFNPDQIEVTDLNANNLEKVYQGIKIKDGMKDTESLINTCDLLLVTGSVFANDTAEPFYRAVLEGKPLYFFGTTVSGIAKILNLPHLCPLGA